MDQPLSIKLQSTFNPHAGWNENVPVLALSNGELATCGFSPQAVYSVSDLRFIAQQLEEAAPEIAAMLTQPTGRQASRASSIGASRQQVQQGSSSLQQQQSSQGNIKQHLQQTV